MTERLSSPRPSRRGLLPSGWTLRPAEDDDAGWMAELRAAVMRPDLERLGRFDPVRVRRRFLEAFCAGHTCVIVCDESPVGLFAVRPEPRERWFEHLYLAPEHQGRGIGGQVLASALEADDDPRPFRLNVLQGSPARRLYERHGFVVEREDEVDVWMVRYSTTHGSARTRGS